MPAKRARRSRVQDRSQEFERILRTPRPLGRYVLRLYVTGSTPRSAQAVANVRSLCEEYLAGNYDLEVVDIYQQPAEAAGEQIIAAPTLIKKLPAPVKRMVGDLSNRDRLLIGLDLQPKTGAAVAPSKTHWVEI